MCEEPEQETVSDGRYRVVDVVPAGYAIRSIVLAQSRDGGRSLLTADVGDDAVSSIDIDEDGVDELVVSLFPKRQLAVVKYG